MSLALLNVHTRILRTYVPTWGWLEDPLRLLFILAIKDRARSLGIRVGAKCNDICVKKRS